MNKSESTLRPIFEQIRDERRTAANTATRVGNALLAIIPFLDTLVDSLDGFLSKTQNDTARGLITFAQGFLSEGAATFNELMTVVVGMANANFRQGKVDGRGWSIYLDNQGKWTIEIDNAIIRNALDAGSLQLENADIDSLRVDEATITEILNSPIFRNGLRSLGDIILGNYIPGVSGGKLTPDGDAELRNLIVRVLATIQSLRVDGDSTFGGRMGSPVFQSGFPGGQGWRLWQKENGRWALEIDDVTIRGSMRVYELIVSQLLGENDNRVFTAMAEVDHYDAATGRIWLDTRGGRLYNPFRQGDYILVQRFQPGNDVVSGGNGWLVKSYELTITGVGSGGMSNADGDRLDWVTFKDFDCDIDDTLSGIITKGDTLCRIDNETDPERKGVVTMMTVGPDTPYMDVHYGMKTDPSRSLKARIGNISGIRTDLFGWLEGFGAYINNLYGVGKFFNAQTGESLQARIEATREHMKQLYEETTYDISDEDNFIENGFFQRGLEGWAETDTAGTAAAAASQPDLVGTGGSPLLFNGKLIAAARTTKVETTSYDGVKVLKLAGAGVSQDFLLLTPNGTHTVMANAESDQASDAQNQATRQVADTLYLAVRMLPLTAGTLSVKFRKTGGTVTGAEWQVTQSLQWQLLQSMDTAVAPWDYSGTGKMVVSYTGECLIRFVALTTDALANNRTQYSTLFEQNARQIRMEARKRTALGETVSSLSVSYSGLLATVTNNKTLTDAAIEQRRQELLNYIATNDPRVASSATWIQTNQKWVDIVAANWDAQGNLLSAGSITVLANGILTQAQTYVGGQLQSYYTKTETAEQITSAMTNFQNGAFYQLQQQADSLEQTMATLATSAQLAAAISKAEQDTATAKSQVEDVIAQNQAAQASVNSALQDGEIDAEERAQLKALRKSLATEYGEASSAYAKVYANPRLADDSTPASAKTNLYNRKAAMDTAYTNVDTAIGQLIATTTLTAGQADQVNTTFNAFNTALQNYRQAIEDAYRAIENALMGEATAAITAARNALQSAVDGLSSSLQTNVSNTQGLMSWKQESQAGYDQVAALYDTATGNIIGLSALIQTVGGLQSTVGTLATVAALNALANSLNASIGNLSDSIDLIESWKNGTFASFQQQTNNSITTLVGRFDNNGGLLELSAYSNTQQTAALISQEVSNLATGRVAALETRATGVEARMTTAEGDIARLKVGENEIVGRVGMVEGYWQLLEDTGFNSGDMDAWTVKNGSCVTFDSKKCFKSTDIGSYPVVVLRQLLYKESPSVKRIEHGKTYTLSCLVRASDSRMVLMTLDQPAIVPDGGISAVTTTATTSWQKIVLTFTTKAGSWLDSGGNTINTVSFSIQAGNNGSSGYIYISQPRLEMGQVAHDYDDDCPGLEGSGFDIRRGLFQARADNFEILNDSGEKTAAVDADGNLWTKGAASFGGTIKATNLYHGVCLVSGTGYYSTRWRCVTDNSWNVYSTEPELQGLSIGDGIQTDYEWDGTVGYTHDADVVILVPSGYNSWPYNGEVLIPPPERYNGKMIEIHHTQETNNPAKVMEAQKRQKFLSRFYFNSSYNTFDGGNPTDNIPVAAGTILRLLSDGNHWIKI